MTDICKFYPTRPASVWDTLNPCLESDLPGVLRRLVHRRGNLLAVPSNPVRDANLADVERRIELLTAD